MAIFDWPTEFQPKEPPKQRTTFRQASVQFGDGYTQTSGSRLFRNNVEISAAFIVLGVESRHRLYLYLNGVGAANFVRWSPPGIELEDATWSIRKGYSVEPIGFEAWEYSITFELENIGL